MSQISQKKRKCPLGELFGQGSGLSLAPYQYVSTQTQNLLKLFFQLGDKKAIISLLENQGSNNFNFRTCALRADGSSFDGGDGSHNGELRLKNILQVTMRKNQANRYRCTVITQFCEMKIFQSDCCEALIIEISSVLCVACLIRLK